MTRCGARGLSPLEDKPAQALKLTAIAANAMHLMKPRFLDRKSFVFIAHDVLAFLAPAAYRARVPPV